MNRLSKWWFKREIGLLRTASLNTLEGEWNKWLKPKGFYMVIEDHSASLWRIGKPNLFVAQSEFAKFTDLYDWVKEQIAKPPGWFTMPLRDERKAEKGVHSAKLIIRTLPG